MVTRRDTCSERRSIRRWRWMMAGRRAGSVSLAGYGTDAGWFLPRMPVGSAITAHQSKAQAPPQIKGVARALTVRRQRHGCVTRAVPDRKVEPGEGLEPPTRALLERCSLSHLAPRHPDAPRGR